MKTAEAHNAQLTGKIDLPTRKPAPEAHKPNAPMPRRGRDKLDFGLIVVEVPMTPNFIRTELGTVSISKFSPDELRKLAVQWGENLVIKAREHKKNPLPL